MMNPYRSIARTTLRALDTLTQEAREEALALVMAQTATKAQEAIRQRVWKLEMPLTFERKIVEGLDNSAHYMKIEMAKGIGLAILDNDKLCMLVRETNSDNVVFTGTVALVPREDWE